MKFFAYFDVLFLFFGGALSTNGGIQDSFPFTSVIDILSQNVEFSTFLRAVQREGYVPYLNELQNYTLFAPVNSAFIDDDESGIDIQNYLVHDSVILSSDIDQGIHVTSLGLKFPVVFERTEDDIISINNATIVDPDLRPNFQNATVHGISSMLPSALKPQEFLKRLEERFDDFHLFNKFTEDISSLEWLATNRTLLLPSDSNFHRFYSDVEINYITDVFNSLRTLSGDTEHIWRADRRRFLQNIIDEKILGGVMLDPIRTENLNGDLLNFESNKHGSLVSVNGSTSTDLSNMVYDRGVVHAFNKLDLLSNIVQFNAEKYLHGLNCSSFVKELYFRNLQHLVQDESLGDNMTIFVPDLLFDGYDGFSRPSLLYHFAGKKIWLEREFPVDHSESTKMYESEYCASDTKMGGNCQRVKIMKVKNGYFINEKYKILHDRPYEVGNTLIYMISQGLKLPGDLESSINPFYGCSSSLIFLNRLNILDLPLNEEGYTVLLPCFNSWESFELNFEYFQKNTTAMNSIMKNLIINGLIYSDFKNMSIESKNLLGEPIKVRVEHSHDGKSLLDLSSVKDKIEIEANLDLFFDQGVVHPLRHLYIPKSARISLKDLIQTAGTSELISLLENYSELASIINNDEPYSLLVPTASSLVGEILNSTRLLDFLKLHIIPGKFTTGLLDCSANVSTTLGDLLACRKDAQGNHFLRVLGGVQNEVRILKRGCTSFHDNSCVFLIDRPISLQWLNRGKSKLRLPRSPLGIGIVIETVILLLCLTLFLYKRKKRITSRGLLTGGDDAQVTRPLIESNERDSHVLAHSTYQ